MSSAASRRSRASCFSFSSYSAGFFRRSKLRALCWVCRLESVYGIARQFLSDEGVRRSRMGVDPGGPRRWRTAGKTVGKPLAKPAGNRWKTGVELAEKTAGDHWQNRWKTAGRPPSNLPRKLSENCRETTGKTVGKLPGDRRRTCREKLSENWRRTAGKPLENRWKTGVELPENRRETVGKTAVERPENRWENRC